MSQTDSVKQRPTVSPLRRLLHDLDIDKLFHVLHSMNLGFTLTHHNGHNHGLWSACIHRDGLPRFRCSGKKTARAALSDVMSQFFIETNEIDYHELCGVKTE